MRKDNDSTQKYLEYISSMYVKREGSNTNIDISSNATLISNLIEIMGPIVKKVQRGNAHVKDTGI